jgi:hypothetical protein
MARQVVVEDVQVQVLQVCRHGEPEAVGTDDLLVHVAQHLEVERVLLGDREAVVRRLRADCHQRRAVSLKAWQCSLQCPQLDVAERAPFASVERQDDRAYVQPLGEGDRLSKGVGEGEPGRPLAELDAGSDSRGCHSRGGGGQPLGDRAGDLGD